MAYVALRKLLSGRSGMASVCFDHSALHLTDNFGSLPKSAVLLCDRSVLCCCENAEIQMNEISS